MGSRVQSKEEGVKRNAERGHRFTADEDSQVMKVIEGNIFTGNYGYYGNINT